MVRKLQGPTGCPTHLELQTGASLLALEIEVKDYNYDDKEHDEEHDREHGKGDGHREERVYVGLNGFIEGLSGTLGTSPAYPSRTWKGRIGPEL